MPLLKGRAAGKDLAGMVDAAVSGDRRKAIQALVSNEQIVSLEEAEKVLDALVKAHGERRARFRQ